MIWSLKKYLNKKNILLICMISILVLFWLDQLTKHRFYDLKYLYNWTLITPVFNKWISWGVLLNLNFINLISLLAIVAFIFFYLKKHISTTEFVLLLSGTIWNLVDRIFLWWVRDFIDLHYWPVFNFADMYLTFAVIIILVREFFWPINVVELYNKLKFWRKNH